MRCLRDLENQDSVDPVRVRTGGSVSAALPESATRSEAVIGPQVGSTDMEMTSPQRFTSAMTVEELFSESPVF